MRVLLCSFVVALAVVGNNRSAEADPTGSSPPAVGMEGQVVVTLPGALLEAKAVDEKAAVVVRVASARQVSGGTEYDLRYMGFEPGEYDLRDYLVRVNGEKISGLPEMKVKVVGVLPPVHDGKLEGQEGKGLPFLGGYRWIVAGVIVVWLGVWIPIVFAGRKKKAAEVVVAPAAPTLADRLRPLVEAAAMGRLTTEGQSQLERLLLWYWRGRLGLTEVDSGEAMIQMRQHPEAGALLRALEGWLHRPAGVEQVDVAGVLAPYRFIPADAVPAEVLGRREGVAV